MFQRRLAANTSRLLNVMQYMGTQGDLSGLDYHVLTLSEHLDRAELNVMLTCAVKNRSEDLEAWAKKTGIPLFPFPTERRNGVSYLRRMLALIRLLRRERVDVLHLHSGGFTGFNALLAAKFAGVRAIIVTHHSLFGDRPHNRDGRMSLWIERLFATRIIAIYNGQVPKLRSLGIPGDRIKVVPNGVNLSRFDVFCNSDDTGESDPGIFRLAISSRLIEGKGHVELLHAVHRLAGRYPGLRLLIIGDGPLRSQLEVEIQALNLEDRVEMVGQVTNSEVPFLLRGAHAVVLPSYMPGETFPTSLIEGMAMNLPAIGTRYVGIPDIIADRETGLLVEPRDLESLIAAIEKMMSDPVYAGEMGRKARARAQEHFSAEALARALTNVYIDASSPKRRPHDQLYRART